MAMVECVWCGDQLVLEDGYGSKSDWNYVCDQCSEELENEDEKL